MQTNRYTSINSFRLAEIDEGQYIFKGDVIKKEEDKCVRTLNEKWTVNSVIVVSLDSFNALTGLWMSLKQLRHTL